MTCNIERPDPQLLFNHYQDMFSMHVLGGAPVIPESNEWYVVGNTYAVAEEFYAISEQAWRERDPRYACFDNLVQMAAVDGVFPRPAQFAQGYVQFTGVPGSAVPPNIEIAVGGQTYVTVGVTPAVIPAEGKFVARVRALVPGVGGNISTVGRQAVLTSAIAGFDNDVIVCGQQFCGGTDEESCNDFRARYLGRLAYRPRATQQWILDKLLEWPCATRAYPRAGSCCTCDGSEDCRPGDCSCIDCGGALGFYVLFDGVFDCGIPPPSLVQEIHTWLFGANQGYGEGQVEVGVCGTLHNITPLRVDVSVTVDSCATQAQFAEIRQQIIGLFATLPPSQSLWLRQVTTIVANIIGSTAAFDVVFDPETRDPAVVDMDECGNIHPACDVLPCLGDINLFGPDTSATGACG